MFSAAMPLTTNPFPGLNPFFQATWSDVHTALIGLIREALAESLPPDLSARAEERIVLEEAGEKKQAYRADVAVVEPWQRGLPPVVSFGSGQVVRPADVPGAAIPPSLGGRATRGNRPDPGRGTRGQRAGRDGGAALSGGDVPSGLHHALAGEREPVLGSILVSVAAGRSRRAAGAPAARGSLLPHGPLLAGCQLGASVAAAAGGPGGSGLGRAETACRRGGGRIATGEPNCPASIRG